MGGFPYYLLQHLISFKQSKYSRNILLIFLIKHVKLRFSTLIKKAIIKCVFKNFSGETDVLYNLRRFMCRTIDPSGPLPWYPYSSAWRSAWGQEPITLPVWQHTQEYRPFSTIFHWSYHWYTLLVILLYMGRCLLRAGANDPQLHQHRRQTK